MTLGQYAVAVGAKPRWVQNARAVLELRGGYTARSARILGLARELSESMDIPLVRAYALARTALAAWPAERRWIEESVDGAIRLEIDIERYLSVFSTRLSLALTSYAERTRGPRSRRRDPITAAREYGHDPTLLELSARMSPAQRLRRLDGMSEFFRRTRRVADGR
jgi:hypothetical protein